MTMGHVSEAATMLRDVTDGFAELRGRHWLVRPACLPNAIPSHQGLDADSLILTGEPPGAPSYFLKIYAKERPFFDFARAVRAATRAGAAGIAPACLGSHAERRAVLFEAAAQPSPQLYLRDIGRPGVRDRVIAQLRRWHMTAPLGAALPPVASVVAAVRDAAGPQLELICPGLSAVCAAAAAIARDLDRQAFAPVPLHGEFMISNMLRDDDGTILLVDFDYAADGDPLVDIASLCLQTARSDEERAAIAAAYFGRESGLPIERLRDRIILEDFRWGAWAVLARAADGADCGVDLLGYLRTRFARCLAHIAMWRPHLLGISS